MNKTWQRVYSLIAPLASLLIKARVLSDFIIYSLGALLTRGISFIILPFIMHKIPPAEYGTLSLLTSFFTIVTAIIGLGLRQVLSIEYFHTNKEERSALISEIVLIYSFIAAPLIMLLWYMRAFVMRILFFNTVTNLQFMAILITSFLFFYAELLYQLMQYNRAAKKLALLQCGIAVLIASCSLTSVFYLNRGITGLIIAQAIGAIIVAFFAALYLLHNFFEHSSIKKSVQKTIYYVWYGLPFIPGIMASWILSSADRWALGYYASMRDVGIYAVADLSCQLFYALVLQAWAGSYLPYIMERYQQHPTALPTIEYENKRIMWITMIGMCITITLGYPVAQLIIPKLVPISYIESLRYIWILLMGQVFLLGSYFASAFIQYKKRTYFLAIALFIPALINIILNICLTPLWGIMGCSFATLISYVIYFMITYLYNKSLIR